MNDNSMNNDGSASEAIALSPIASRFVLHWGEMGTRWGVNRTVSQIHALLYLVGKPLNAEAIADTLQVARSNVSNSLKELQSWKLVSVTHLMGDKRDHFETSCDVWQLFRTVIKERKAREFDPTVTVLQSFMVDADFSSEEKSTRLRIQETLALMQALSSWGEEMLRLEPQTLMKIMKLGAKIQALVRSPANKASKQRA